MSSLIAKTIGVDELVGSVLIGASMVLTTHSVARMIFLRRTASRFFLFPIINIAQLLNQIFVFLLVTAAIGTITFNVALWLNVLNNVAYFITKPTVMYLAYLRCSAVMPVLKKGAWVHHILISIRAIELFAIVVINIAANVLCEGSIAQGTRCASFQIAWTVRDAGAPLFRFYVIACEAIFYYKLFGTLRSMSGGKHVKVLRYRRLQTSLFTLDLAIMTFMSIYRIIGIWNKTLPTYVYMELFSSTLTIFNLTEFGLNIRSLFGAASDGQPQSSSMNHSSANKVEMRSIEGSYPHDSHYGDGGNGGANLYYNSNSLAAAEEGGRQTPSYNRHNSSSSRRPLTSSSSTPLTAYTGSAGHSHAHGSSAAAGQSDTDLTASEPHRDYSPFPAVGGSTPVMPSRSLSPPLYRSPFHFGHSKTTTATVATTDSEDSNGHATSVDSSVAQTPSLDEPWRLTIAELIAGREHNRAVAGAPPSHLEDPYVLLDIPFASPSSSSSPSSTSLAQPYQHPPSSIPQAQEHPIIDPASFQQQAQFASSISAGGPRHGLKQDLATTTSPPPSVASSPRLPLAAVVGGGSGRLSEDQHLSSPSRPHRAHIVPDRSAARRRP